MPTPHPRSPLGERLGALIRAEMQAAGGWMPFDRFMSLALYAPGLGYYSRGSQQFGARPEDGSDFITAPEISPLFGRALARQVAQALSVTGTDEVWEFGAGSGILAAQLLATLGELGQPPRRYTIVDVSGTLRERQQQTLLAKVPQWADRVVWADRLPDELNGVVVGNEVLDAMPVKLITFDGQTWLERGVALDGDAFVWADRASDLRPPVEGPFVPGTVTELQQQGEAFITTLAGVLRRGAAFFIDYGFPEAEYFHPQRVGGTLMCHQAHRSDDNPLIDVGDKDITAHVNFTGIALAAQDAGLDVLGYTSQAHFLINCGITDDLQHLQSDADRPARSAAQLLMLEHEMGELFKVIGLARGEFEALGFARGDRSHTL